MSKKISRWTRVVAAALVAIGATSAFATDCTPKSPEYCTPQQLEQLRQRQAQAQQQLADARAELSAALTNLNQVTANPNSTSEARAAAQARVDNANRNLNVAQGGAAAATITAAISGGDNAASANGAAGNTTTTTTTTNTKVVNADPVTAYLQSLPVHPQATADTDYICEFRGRPHKVDRNVFYNGTRTEGPVKTGLDAFVWQYATKKGADGKILTDEYGDPKKFPYSRYLLPFGDHKLPDNFAFEGEMKERMTQNGYWVEVGTVVKYTYLTSGAAYNGSWAAAFGSESRQGSVAAGSSGNIQDRVVVEVKDLNQSCVLNRGELDLIKGLFIPPTKTSQAPKAQPEATVAVELVKDEKEVRLPLVHAIGAKPAATPWGACGRDPRTGAVITVTEAEYKAGKRCPAEVTDRKVEYHLRGPGSVAQPLQVLTPANPAPAAQ